MFLDQSCSFGMRQLVGFHASQPRQLLSMSGCVKCNFTVNKIHFEPFVPCCAKKNVNTANTSYGCEDYVGCFCTSALASRLMLSASFSRSNTSANVCFRLADMKPFSSPGGLIAIHLFTGVLTCLVHCCMYVRMSAVSLSV